jgi:hypothetical protein
LPRESRISRARTCWMVDMLSAPNALDSLEMYRRKAGRNVGAGEMRVNGAEAGACVA